RQPPAGLGARRQSALRRRDAHLQTPRLLRVALPEAARRLQVDQQPVGAAPLRRQPRPPVGAQPLHLQRQGPRERQLDQAALLPGAVGADVVARAALAGRPRLRRGRHPPPHLLHPPPPPAPPPPPPPPP